MLKFSLSELRDEYNKYVTERDGKKNIRNKNQIQDLRRESYMFERKRHSKDNIIYMNGNPTGLAGNLTEIFMTNDAFVVKKTKLQKEDAGIYWIAFRATRLGRNVLIITGKPKMIGRYPPNPVLKPEDNYTSIIQLECHSVSTSIGECPLSMYTVWYKNGMKMTDIDPTLSQINVTVDHNGGNFTCLGTDYLPCYQRLQTTTHDDDLNIEVCNNVFESETFIVQPEYAPIDVKLDPDQREITVNKNEDLKVRCSAKCHPQGTVTWEKDYKVLRSNGSIFITENMLENDLVIENINSSHEGVYVCLVNNIHGESKKNFTLSVTETGEKVVNGEDNDEVAIAVIVCVSVTLAVIGVAVIVVVIMYKKYHTGEYIPDRNGVTEYISFEESILDEYNETETFTDNNSKNGDQNMNTESGSNTRLYQ